MALITRKRYNLCSTTLGAALTNSATSITLTAALKEGGGSGTNIPTLGTDEYLFLRIDDELVALTAYTTGATTGTIARAQEQTVAVAHSNGAWVSHVGTKSDAGPVVIYMDISGDETTAVTTGTAKRTIRAPFAFTLTAVRASLTTASTSGLPTVNIKESGTTVLSTKLTLDVSEKTSTTAATAAVISDSAIADDAEITFDVDVAGTGAAGLKVWMYGTRVV